MIYYWRLFCSHNEIIRYADRKDKDEWFNKLAVQSD